ncbi:V-type proton ATPase subunit D2 [Tanacetum coccineum]
MAGVASSDGSPNLSLLKLCFASFQCEIIFPIVVGEFKDNHLSVLHAAQTLVTWWNHLFSGGSRGLCGGFCGRFCGGFGAWSFRGGTSAIFNNVKRKRFDANIHFSGLKAVGERVLKPLMYVVLLARESIPIRFPLRYGHMIDNLDLIVTGTLHERDVQELLEKCHPLGICPEYARALQTVVIDTPLTPYFFSECIASEVLYC